MARLLLHEFSTMSALRLLLALSVGLFTMLGSISLGHAQTRTKTKTPYPISSKSVSWIVNIPYTMAADRSNNWICIFLPTVVVNR